RYVKIEDTVRSFKEIIEGRHDEIPERAFSHEGPKTSSRCSGRARSSASSRSRSSSPSSSPAHPGGT
ncbi:hypothetical protein F1715_11630, partial [Streptococcus pneumoniae]